MMPPSDQPAAYSVSQFIQEKVLSWYNYFLSKRLFIFITAILFAAAGVAYAFVKKPYYIAESTFVLDNTSSSAGGSYASLAALAGISLDNGSSAFSGDNILDLYQSRTMLEKTLLSRAMFDDKQEVLINKYIQDIPKWKKFKNISRYDFNKDKANFSKSQDSILYEIAKEVRNNYLTVSKAEKKSVISVKFKFKDEMFAYWFDQKLVDNVNQSFITLRTNKSLQNVSILQHQADSVRRMLHINVAGAAAATDVVPNANPFQQSLKVPVQYKAIDAQANTSVYAELIRNLELAKVALMKETPLIQSIDKPEIPLEKEKASKPLYLIVGFMAGLVFSIILLFVARLLKIAR